MSRLLLRAGLGALVVGLGWAAGAADAQQAASAAVTPRPALELFGQLPAARLLTMSPNGRFVAMEEAKADGGRQVVVLDVDAGKTHRSVAVDPDYKVRDLDWADDGTLLLDVSIMLQQYCRPNVYCNYEFFRTLVVPMDGSRPRTLLNDDGAKKLVTGSVMLAARTAQPGVVTMATLDYSQAREKQDTGTNFARTDRDKTGWTWAVFAVDTRSGKEKLLATGTPYTDDWVVDAAGMPVARSEWQPDRKRYAIYARQGAGWKEVFVREDGSRLRLAGLDLAGKAIVALGANDAQHKQAWSVPLDGSPVTLLAADPAYDIDRSIFDPNRNAVVGVGGTSDVETHWFDPKFASQEKSLRNAFKGQQVTVLGRSAVGRRVLVEVATPSTPPVYQLVDFDKGRAEIVAEAYPGLDPAALGTASQISYLARDGLRIPAILTLPSGTAGKNLPTVILPHGGPQWRDEFEFDWLAQSLATRGYVVLQPQFRGSTGYGEEFRLAGYRQWGGLMQDDVSDGVRHLVATGIADPGRICIVGASYGGYAALAGAAFTPELYACAASIAGISDLPLMLGTERKNMGSDSDAVAYWNDHIGPANDPNVIGKSPARFAGKVRAPVLLIHGVDDTVVPIQQSRTMERALTEAGKPVTMVTLPGEDHWLSRSATRVRVLQELDAFLAKYLQ